MHLIIRVLILICFCGNLLGVFGQSTTTRSGFAVVTVVAGDVAGLIATENLTNTINSGFEERVVGPSPLITRAFVLVNVGSGTETTTAIALANPSSNASGVQLLLTDRRGGVVLNTTVHLGPLGQLATFLNELFGTDPPEFSSPLLLTLSSDIPVAVVAFNFRGASFVSIPVTTTTFVGTVRNPPLIPTPVFPTPVPSPVNTVIFAQVAAGGDWSTLINLANTLDGTQIVRIDFFGSNGFSFGSLTDIVIPARSVVSLSTDSLITAVE